MKLFIILIFLLFNTIFWSLINCVENEKNLNEGTSSMSKEVLEKSNEMAESSVNPQSQKYKEMLKPKFKINKNTKKDINGNELGRKLRKAESDRKYYRKNKQKINENNRIYYKKNEVKRREYANKYYQKNKEKKREYDRKKYIKNKDKMKENMRKYRQKKKNEKEILQKELTIQSVNQEGTSFVHPQNNNCEGKGKESCEEESLQLEEAPHEDGTPHEEESLHLEGTEKNNKEEENPFRDIDLNLPVNGIDLNKKLQFDLNKEPEGCDEI
ncbi:unnamed protein product [Meloidogyne enterolobii]|uniref:Uncharacterized protein n=1 Tax=Meloidogyne enterolobii TaxID=390850 RepID=A0ACB0YF13_MELEN